MTISLRFGNRQKCFKTGVSMKKSRVSILAAVAVLAGFCVSGQSARVDHEEVAMAKCTKSSESCETTNEGFRQERSCARPKTSGEKEVRGAARKVVEGKETSSNEVGKSAARKAVEAELAFRLEE